MKKGSILINGQQVPIRMTMGALLRFKRETGKEVAELGKDDDMSIVLVLIWACAISASKADGIDFNPGFEEFCDMLSPEQFTEATQILFTKTDSKKKA